MNLKEQLVECMLKMVKEKIEETMDFKTNPENKCIQIERYGDWFKMACNDEKLMEFNLNLLEEEQ